MICLQASRSGLNASRGEEDGAVREERGEQTDTDDEIFHVGEESRRCYWVGS